LPEGWLGKLNALAKGLEASRGEWALFSDADVHLEPGSLEAIVAYAESEKADFVAVLPRMEPVSLPIDAGVAVFLRVVGIAGRTWRANDDRSSVGMGVGAFNLVRREVLEKSHAIEKLRMEIADDVALGALLKQSGFRCRLLCGRQQVHLRWQTSLRAMVRSFDKAGGTMDFSLPKALIGGLLTLDFVIPCVALAQPGPARTLGILALGLIWATHILLSRHFAAPLRGALAWPLGALLISALTLRAGLLAWWRQGVTWRGTFYGKQAIQEGRRLALVSLRIRQ
jgi:glycosyltransferase involved in cell wall biosynthesis